ncbi:glycosyltransferase family 2 protein [Actibacterium lipolyticum]|uniref:Glycosyl transferase family 2 n=1 Tax=Actibacterium lipolyticum TaxID=1524263 RepID=A0A238JWR8_9RHOB|nr:glycosyltransferase family 2 protein [Actibacterium lipolyticum]SMX34282.1 hypothetical protein COL8621_01239 [Actibacterium lipolyticum]
MRIYVHIGLSTCGADRIQSVFNDKRDQLAGKGILYPHSLGKKNHTRLFMACTDPDHIDPLRFARGNATEAEQSALREAVTEELAREVERVQPHMMILSAAQLATSLNSTTELARLRDMLTPYSDDIRIVAHIDEQARVLVRHYGTQVLAGRATPLSQELDIAAGDRPWRDACLEHWDKRNANLNQFPEVTAPPFWLDYEALQENWESVFGAGSVTFRPYDEEVFASPDLTEEMCEAFDLPRNIGKAQPSRGPVLPSAAWLTRARQINTVLNGLLEKKKAIPRRMWRRLMEVIEIPGDPITPGSLSALSISFEASNKRLLKAHTGLKPETLKRNRKIADWQEAEPELGFRPTQYVAAFAWHIDKATRQQRRARKEAEQAAKGVPVEVAKPEPAPQKDQLSPAAEKLLPPAAIANYEKLKGGTLAPHNRIGLDNDADLAAAFSEVPMRELPKGNSGNVIVGCMKNEAPYILEWVAYHRAIGVDNFIIYTNGCEDGTSEILDRLQELGVLQHRNNDEWKGNSPQQYALNQSLKEDVIKNAEWIIHIDVDEFINVRCGNGTLADFIERIPDATNVAMTWRLFGHNDVREYRDDLVIDQFETCAPKYCPKPHTVWGFKTMFRNIGAYEKISCHRPNKLDDAFRDKVSWVNGSGEPMADDVLDNGWRSSKRSIGYDLLQLNHYALRSAESFLIKRQRGRALHVDRSIGLNYWIRMDWSDHKDVSIKRNLARTRAELDRLLQDKKLLNLHEAAVEWHKQKAKSLHAMPEFQELYEQAIGIKLNALERVAYSLALEVDN